MSKLGAISQERLKIEVKLLLSANRKSFMRRRLAQQQMTLSDPEWSFHGSVSRAISAVAELLVDLFRVLSVLQTVYRRQHVHRPYLVFRVRDLYAVYV